MKEKIAGFKEEFSARNAAMQNEMLFDFLKNSGVHTPGECRGSWQLFGHPVSLEHFCLLLSIGKHRVLKMMQTIRGGATGPDADMRSANMGRDAKQYRDCDAFLYYIYQFECVPLAEGVLDLELEPLQPDDDVFEADNSLLSLATEDCGQGDVVAEAKKKKLPCKQMDHTEFSDFHEDYCGWTVLEQPASIDVLRRAYRKGWCGQIRMRKEGQHAHCTFCLTTKERRKKAKTTEMQKYYDLLLLDHRKGNLADRACDARENALSEKSCDETQQLATRVLKLDHDGMDQAEFCIPRHNHKTKAMESCWRPNFDSQMGGQMET